MGPGGGGRLGLALGPRCLWAAAMGWAPPRLAAGARYGLWAATRRGAAAPRGARGLRGSNPFTRGQEEEWRRRNRTALTYIAAAAVGMVGMSYAAVPLYRLYCQVPGGPRPPPSPLGERAAGLSAAFAFAQATGLGGTTGAGRGAARIEEMEAVKERVVKVTFNADVHSSLQWNFRPQQSEIYVSGFLPSVPPLTYSQRRLGGFGFCLRRFGRLTSRSCRALRLCVWALIWKETQLGPAPELTLQAASPALLGKAGPLSQQSKGFCKLLISLG